MLHFDSKAAAMKKITISLEDEAGTITRMTTISEAKLVLLDFGLSPQEVSTAFSALSSQLDVPVISFAVQSGISAASRSQVSMLTCTKDTEADSEHTLINGAIKMNTLRHEVLVDGRKINLTPREYGLLEYFLRHIGRILPHHEILRKVWGDAHINDTQYLRVYIGQLRNKLEVSKGLGKLIVAEAGVGYRMDKAQLYTKVAA